jgi:hypothetical protein
MAKRYGAVRSPRARNVGTFLLKPFTNLLTACSVTAAAPLLRLRLLCCVSPPLSTGSLLRCPPVVSCCAVSVPVVLLASPAIPHRPCLGSSLIRRRCSFPSEPCVEGMTQFCKYAFDQS